MAESNAEGGAFWAYTYSTEPSEQTSNNHQMILLLRLLLEFLGFFPIGPWNLRLLDLDLRLINYDDRSIYICLCDGLKPPTGSIHIVDPIGGLLSVERVEALIEGHSVEQLCDIVLIIGIESLLRYFGFNQLIDAFYQLQDEFPLTFRVRCNWLGVTLKGLQKLLRLSLLKFKSLLPKIRIIDVKSLCFLFRHVGLFSDCVWVLKKGVFSNPTVLNMMFTLCDSTHPRCLALRVLHRVPPLEPTTPRKPRIPSSVAFRFQPSEAF